MGTQPNDYDRLMGVTSVGSQEPRFGEESDPESENELDRAAHSSENLGKTGDGEAMYHDANPGVDEIQGGFGSVSLRECLGTITQPATSSATRRSGEGLEDSMCPHHTNPPQVMSPNLDQTHPQSLASGRRGSLRSGLRLDTAWDAKWSVAVDPVKGGQLSF